MLWYAFVVVAVSAEDCVMVASAGLLSGGSISCFIEWWRRWVVYWLIFRVE
jgi:hypothetical protein